MKSGSSRRKPPMRRQNGAALTLILVLTAITGLLVLSQTTGVMRQFNMSRNERDIAVAIQAAEAALRDAEADVQCLAWIQPEPTQSQIPEPILQVVKKDDTNNARPHCLTQRVPTCTELMPTESSKGMRRLGRNPVGVPAAIAWDTPGDECTADNCPVSIGSHTAPLSNTSLLAINGVAMQPLYHVDVVDVISDSSNDTVPLFRITARGYGSSAATAVTLQSVYRPRC